MSRFAKCWFAMATVGCASAPVFFYMGSYLSLMKAMAPDEPFDQKPAGSLQEAANRFDALTPEAKQVYQSHLVWDVPFFLAMGLASSSLLLLAWGPRRTWKAYCLILFFTIGFVACDAIENALLATWFNGDGPTLTTVSLLSFITPAKFGSLALTVPVLIAGIVTGIRERRSQSNPTPDDPG